MADQASSDIASVTGEGQLAAPTATVAAATGAAEHGSHGRPLSWAAVVIILVGFIAGGFGLIIGPTWWLFWTGMGLAGAGCILALGTGIFNDWY